MRSLKLAIQFLTILPLRVGGEVAAEHLRGALAWFPVVGLMIGGLLAALARYVLPSVPDRIACLLLVLAGLLLTGALHLDGLADVADALCARKDRQGRLDVMKDPRVGAAGAAAAALALLFRWELLAELPWQIRLQALILAPLVGRAAMVLILRVLPPAKPDGLAASWGPPSAPAVALALLLAAGLPIALHDTLGLKAVAWAALGVGLLVSVSARAFGGVTGDVCGAAGEVSELCFLGGCLAWSAA